MKLNAFFLLVAVLALLSPTCAIGDAATFTVNDLGNEGDANPGDGNCATSNGVCTLRAAIEEANALNGPVTIVFDVRLSGTIDLSAGTAAPLEISAPITIEGLGADVITVSGADTVRVFDVLDDGAATITALTIANGMSPVGGGASVALAAKLNLEQCQLTGNQATEFGGGAIFNDGEVTVTATQFSLNFAAADGGAIVSNGPLTITDSGFTNNEASLQGGAIAAFGMLSVQMSTFDVNRGANGGAIAAAGQVAITDSTFSTNQATFGGGAISSGGQLTIERSTFTQNTASDGGAINATEGLTLINSTFSGNQARFNGGAVFSDIAANVFINNTTIANNTANSDDQDGGQGGGIFLTDPQLTGRGFVEIANTIIGNNVALLGGVVGNINNPDCFGFIDVSAYNLIRTVKAQCQINFDLNNASLFDVDPLLGPLADNGGPTQTLALLQGSPAIDTGNPATVATGGNSCEDIDQRGEVRPRNGKGAGATPRCDIGAFEVQSPSEVQSTGGVTDGDRTLPTGGSLGPIGLMLLVVIALVSKTVRSRHSGRH